MANTRTWNGQPSQGQDTTLAFGSLSQPHTPRWGQRQATSQVPSLSCLATARIGSGSNVIPIAHHHTPAPIWRAYNRPCRSARSCPASARNGTSCTSNSPERLA